MKEMNAIQVLLDEDELNTLKKGENRLAFRFVDGTQTSGMGEWTFNIKKDENVDLIETAIKQSISNGRRLTAMESNEVVDMETLNRLFFEIVESNIIL